MHNLLENARVHGDGAIRVVGGTDGTCSIFIVDDRLVPVQRAVAVPVTLDDVTAILIGGPGSDDDERLRTALHDGIVKHISLRAGAASIAVFRDFKDLSTAEQQLAVGQLVMTMTARPGIGQVSFTIDDEPVPVPKGDGSLADGLVSRDDDSSLVRPP